MTHVYRGIAFMLVLSVVTLAVTQQHSSSNRNLRSMKEANLHRMGKIKYAKMIPLRDSVMKAVNRRMTDSGGK